MVDNTYEKSCNELLIFNRGMNSPEICTFLAMEVYESVNNLNLWNLEFIWNHFNVSALLHEMRKGKKLYLLETRTCQYEINSLSSLQVYNRITSPVMLKKVILRNNISKRLRN